MAWRPEGPSAASTKRRRSWGSCSRCRCSARGSARRSRQTGKASKGSWVLNESSRAQRPAGRLPEHAPAGGGGLVEQVQVRPPDTGDLAAAEDAEGDPRVGDIKPLLSRFPSQSLPPKGGAGGRRRPGPTRPGWCASGTGGVLAFEQVIRQGWHGTGPRTGPAPRPSRLPRLQLHGPVLRQHARQRRVSAARQPRPSRGRRPGVDRGERVRAHPGRGADDHPSR
jgi:hypothetical protein